MALVQSLMTMTRLEFQQYREGGSTRIALWRDHYDIDIAVEPDQESAKTKIRLMEAVLAEGREFAEERDVEFVVLIEPSIIDMTKDNFPIGYTNLELFPGYRRTNLVDAVEKICRDNDIPFVNLYPTFAANRPEDLYFKFGNDHWNDAGQELAADTMAKYLVDRGVFDSAERAVDTARSAGSRERS
jgi:hypothetical protein